jgi:hypothetical protein
MRGTLAQLGSSETVVRESLKLLLQNAACYPDSFRDLCTQVKSGNPSGLEILVRELLPPSLRYIEYKKIVGSLPKPPSQEALKEALSLLMNTAAQNPGFIRASYPEMWEGQWDLWVACLIRATGVDHGGLLERIPQWSDVPARLVVGEKIEEQGVPFARLSAGERAINLNLIPDFLRDASGEPISVTYNRAAEIITDFNQGIRYGTGTEEEIGEAVASDHFRDGTFILARRYDLEKIASQHKSNPTLKPLSQLLEYAPGNEVFFISSTAKKKETPRDHKLSDIYQAEISFWDDSYCCSHSGSRDGMFGHVVLLRGFTCC